MILSNGNKKIIEGFIYDPCFRKAVLSGKFYKKNGYDKIVLTAFVKNEDTNRLYYQFSLFSGSAVKHENAGDAASAVARLFTLAEGGYKHWDVFTQSECIQLLLNKKGNQRLNRVKAPPGKGVSFHNKQKNHILPEGAPVPWMVSLGITDNAGYILKDKQKKFRQINRFLEIAKEAVPLLPDAPVIIDIGCGKSYLSFALYDYLRMNDKKPRITGLDLKDDLVARCNKLAGDLNFHGLSFQTGDIREFNRDEPADMVICLHACDTSTDYALYKAVVWRAKAVFAAPCCQHELLGQMDIKEAALILKHGILKEKFAALLTDGLRAALLEAAGYKCRVMEFTDTEDTAKNVLIRGIKRDNTEKYEPDLDGNPVIGMTKDLIWKQIDDLIKKYNAEPTLYRLLKKSTPRL